MTVDHLRASDACEVPLSRRDGIGDANRQNGRCHHGAFIRSHPTGGDEDAPTGTADVVLRSSLGEADVRGLFTAG